MNTVETIKSLLLHTGASWIMWFLGVLSLLSITVIIERAWVFRAMSGSLEGVALALDEHLRNHNYDEALRVLNASQTMAASVAAAGLSVAGRGVNTVDKTMQSALALQRNRLEKWLSFLGTLGNNAPFIGLFGTVVGVIEAFDHLGRGHGDAGAAMASTVATQAVMSSIAEALVATAVGILVALPAVAANNYFQRKIASLVSGAEVLTHIILAYIGDSQGHGRV